MSEHERTLVDKLNKMTNTQMSIQSLSLWLIYHKKRAESSVTVWKREILSAPANRKLVYLYLANDVLQNAKKDTHAFEDAFSQVIVDVVAQLWRDMTSKDQKSFERMIGIWQERRVFASDIIQSLRKATSARTGGDTGSGTSTRSLNVLNNTNSSNFDKRATSSFQSVPMSPPSPASMSSGADGSVASSLPSEFTNKAVYKALQALVDVEIENNQNRCTLKTNEQLIHEFNTVMAGASDESTLEAMDLPQLQQLQYQYDGILRKFADVKTGFSRENSARKKYIAILKQELEKEQRAFQDYDKVIREWTRNVANLQQFQTNIECSVTNKKMLQSDTLVNDYFNADHHQLQNTLGKKRTFSEMETSDSVPAINHHRQPNMHHPVAESSVFAHDADSFMNKRQKLDRPALPPTVEDVEDIYVPEELNINAPQQDMNSILDALENTRNTHSLEPVPAQHVVNMGDFITQEMNVDNYPPPFLSDSDPFSDENGM